MKKVLIIIVLISTLISCTNDSINSSELKIRLFNVSQFEYKNIRVNTSTGEVKFEDINPGQKTDYKTFDTAYRYAFIELEIDGKTYTIQPIDYVGESPLDKGNYTYQIDANNSQDQYGKLNLSLIEE